MDFDKTIKKRSSIRDYYNKKVKIDKVIDAIEAANLAPSPGNIPILKYIIIENKETINQIAQACQQDFVANACFLVVVCSDKKKVEIMYDIRAEKYTKHHAGAAVENFLLKITEMKLASCWVGAFSDTTIKNILKIPEDIDVEAVLPVAYPSKIKKQEQKSKTSLNNIIYFEKYKNKFQKPERRISHH